MWSLKQIQIPSLWRLGLTGERVRVGIVGTGVDLSHPDFAKNSINAFSVVGSDVSDTVGHETGIVWLITRIAPRADVITEYLTVDPVTLIREGVYSYDDGRAYKPGIELAAAAEVAGDLRIAWDHPPQKVITNHKEVKGFANGIHVVKNSKGDRIKGRMTFLKKRLTEDQIELIRSKARPDVSLGFYYTEDRTPGSWNGQAYDYVQRRKVNPHSAEGTYLDLDRIFDLVSVAICDD